MSVSIRIAAIVALLVLGVNGPENGLAKGESKGAAAAPKAGTEKPTIAVLYFDATGDFTIRSPGYVVASQLQQVLQSGFAVVDYEQLNRMLAEDGLLMSDLRSICQGRGGPELLAAARKSRCVEYLVVGSVSKDKKGLLKLTASMCDWQSGQTDVGRQVTLEQKGWVDFVARLPEFAAKLTGQMASLQAGHAKPLTLAVAGATKITLVRVPAGRFIMGSAPGEKHRGADEGPRRALTITNPFYMGVTEVTQKQYQALMGTTPWKRKASPPFKDMDFPATTVTWVNATDFCNKLSTAVGKTVRLPTEAEWEYACRAGSKTVFCYGDDPDCTRLWRYASCKQSPVSGGPYGTDTDSVAWHRPNAWGLYDMHGGVWEWCSDRYAPSYDKAATEDPQGPDAGDSRVVRDGARKNLPWSCRSANRHWVKPTHKERHIGFRIVIPADEVSK